MKNTCFILFVTLLFFLSCKDVFEKDISDMKVEVVAPGDGAVVEEGNVVFLWRQLHRAKEYRLTIVSPSFAYAAELVADTLVILNDTLQVDLKCSYELSPGRYQWKIRANNNGYASMESTRNLTVIAKQNDEPEGPEGDGDGVHEEEGEDESANNAG